MCVRTIIDASAFRHLCEKLRNTAGHQLRQWITNGDGLVVYTEDLEYGEELKRSNDAYALLLDYRQRGLAERFTAAQIQAGHEHIPDRPIRQSNDPHVLALAAASQATVLFSCDSDLRRDFADHKVLLNVGTQTRRSVPLKIDEPHDTTDAVRRRRFFGTRRCTARR